MLRILLVAVLLSVGGPALAGDVWVQGYVRKDGTYVRPHVRTAPDSNRYNNYSSPGVVNPYTGKVARPVVPNYGVPTLSQPQGMPLRRIRPGRSVYGW